MHVVDLPPDHRLWSVALPVLQELRPHLTAQMLEQVLREGTPQGLRFLAVLDESQQCLGVAGWRVIANTSAGRKFYVDDLVTTAASRSRGVGALLLREMEQRAIDAGCRLLDLDSGVQRQAAHRFYFRERMGVTAFHFTKELSV